MTPSRTEQELRAALRTAEYAEAEADALRRKLDDERQRRRSSEARLGRQLMQLELRARRLEEMNLGLRRALAERWENQP